MAEDKKFDFSAFDKAVDKPKTKGEIDFSAFDDAANSVKKKGSGIDSTPFPLESSKFAPIPGMGNYEKDNILQNNFISYIASKAVGAGLKAPSSIRNTMGDITAGIASMFTEKPVTYTGVPGYGFTTSPDEQTKSLIIKSRNQGLDEAINKINVLSTPKYEKELKARTEKEGIISAPFAIQSLGALTESIGANVLTGGLGIYANIFEEGYSDALKKGLTSNEALVYGSSIAGVNAYLEKRGLDAILKSVPKPIKDKVSRYLAGKAMSALVKSGVELTEDAIQNAIKKEVNSFSGKVLQAGAKGLYNVGTEGGTETLQELSSWGIEETTNYLKKQKIFKTDDAAKRFLTAFAGGAIGGGTAGSLSSLVGSDNTFNYINEEVATKYNNIEEYNNFKTTLAEDLHKNNVPDQSIEKVMSEVDKMREKHLSIPQTVPEERRQAVYNIISERDKIQNLLNDTDQTTVDPAFARQANATKVNGEAAIATLNDLAEAVGSGKKIIYRQTENGYEKEVEGEIEPINELMFNYAKLWKPKGIKIEGDKDFKYYEKDGKYFKKFGAEGKEQPITKATYDFETKKIIEEPKVEAAKDIEAQKADIETRRQEELKGIVQTTPIEVYDENGNVVQTSDKAAVINAKYDAELAALEQKIQEESPDLNTQKREKIVSSLKLLRDNGVLVSANKTFIGKLKEKIGIKSAVKPMSDSEIDAQMQILDAMSKVWKQTTGKDNFYTKFVGDIKEGNIEALKEKGGVLFQDDNDPVRPVSRVSLAVFDTPQLSKMRGQIVAIQSITDFIKSNSKQIEKDIINSVLASDKYSGLKRIDFDVFKSDVETEIMTLDRIKSFSYATYGMSNLGNNNVYGPAETIIYNSPINHGEVGHFRADYKNDDSIKWVIKRLPGEDSFVAIRADMPEGLSPVQMQNYVGTAGTQAAVKNWVNDQIAKDSNVIGLFGHVRNWVNEKEKTIYLAELQSDYFQKNKASDLWLDYINQDELQKETARLKDENYKKLYEYLINERNYVTEFLPSKNGNSPFGTLNFYRKDGDVLTLIDDFLVDGNKLDPETLHMYAESAYRKEREMFGVAGIKEYNEFQVNSFIEYKKEVANFINSKIEELKKSGEYDSILNQFVASQKNHELRIFREAIKNAGEEGFEKLRFPSPYTIALIEGYINDGDEFSPPYEIVYGDDDNLIEGDIIRIDREEYIVWESDGYQISVLPRESNVYTYDLQDYIDGEISNASDEFMYQFKKQLDSGKTYTKQDIVEVEDFDDHFGKFDNVKSRILDFIDTYKRNITVDEIADIVQDIHQDEYNNWSTDDLFDWVGGYIMQDSNTVLVAESMRGMETFLQPSEYRENSNAEADFEDNLSEEQATVVNKYKSLIKSLSKLRPNNFKEVLDDNGRQWYETQILPEDKSNPIIAFQKEGAKIKGAVDFSLDSKANLYFFNGADVSTLAHEMTGHIGRRVLEQLSLVDKTFAADYEAIKKWANVKDNEWTRMAEEKFARAFERYLRIGVAPTKSLAAAFAKMKDWLKNIYKTIKGSSIDIELTKEVTNIFDRLLTETEDAIKISNKPVIPVGKEGGNDKYQGAKEGQSQVGEPEGRAGETTQPKANRGDSNIGSEAQQKEINVKFAKAAELFYAVNETTDRSTKRKQAAERRQFLEENPSIKYIDDNLKSIMDQLEESKKLTKTEGCP